MLRLLTLLSSALFAVTLLSSCGNSASNTVPKSEPATQPFKVIGYIIPSRTTAQQSLDSLLPYLTHLNIAFANPTDDGSGEIQPLNHKRIQSIVAQSHAHNVKVFLSLGGWRGDDGGYDLAYERIAANPKAAERFIDNILELTHEFQFDGIDLDWEYPRLEYADDYADFVEQLASALHREDKQLTAAVIGTKTKITDDGDGAAYLDRAIAAYDWINLMAYDDRPDNHSPRDLVKRSTDYWLGERQVPADKVVLGLPMYARPSWRGYAEVLAAHPEAACVDQVIFKGKSDYYNGLPTISHKTQQALDMGLAGVMTWELPLDSFDSKTSIMATIDKTIQSDTSLLDVCIDSNPQDSNPQGSADKH